MWVFSSLTVIKIGWRKIGRMLRHDRGALCQNEECEKISNREYQWQGGDTLFYGWNDLELLSEGKLTLVGAVRTIVHTFGIGRKRGLGMLYRPCSWRKINRS